MKPSERLRAKRDDFEFFMRDQAGWLRLGQAFAVCLVTSHKFTLAVRANGDFEYLCTRCGKAEE